MNRIEMKESFINSLERERIKRGWKQQEMAEKLEMSLPGYRKMIAGLTESVSLSTAMIASEVLEIPIRTLCGYNDLKDVVSEMIYQQSDSVCERVKYYLCEERMIAESYKSLEGKERFVDMIKVTGYLKDGMILDSYTIEKYKIHNAYGNDVRKALLITENTFLPVYGKGDIVLIDENLARNGDITVIMNVKTRKFYIRKLIIKGDYELHPIIKKGDIIHIKEEDRGDWIDFGHVVTCIKQ